MTNKSKSTTNNYKPTLTPMDKTAKSTAEGSSTESKPEFDHNYDTAKVTIEPIYESRHVEVRIKKDGTTQTTSLAPANALKTASVIEDVPPEFLGISNPEEVSKTLQAAVEWLKTHSSVHHVERELEKSL